MKVYGIIYKIINLTNFNYYIGKTVDLRKRIKKHIYEKNNMPIHLAIKKYGVDNFIISIIDYARSKKELDEKEIYYISFYGKSYNVADGGKGGYSIPKGSSKETHPHIAKMAKKMTGLTKETDSRCKKAGESYSETCKNPTEKMVEGRRKGRLAIIEKWKNPTEAMKKMGEKVGLANSPYYKNPTLNILNGRKKTSMKAIIRNQNPTEEMKKGFQKISNSLKVRAKNPTHSMLIGRKKIGKKTAIRQKGQNNSMSKTNIEKRKFKKENPELFSFNKEIPPILSINYCTNKPEVNNID